MVVGAGITGLTAARDLALAGEEVLVLEAADAVGGKIARREVGGVSVDVGAEAMLARRPEGVDLAADLGVPVEHPAIASSRIWSRGALRPLPRSLMGVPLDLGQLAASGVLSRQALDRVRREPGLPACRLEADVSVGDLVDRRFGTEVTDRLVEPLLGGVYAGHAREISARAAVPQLVAYAARGSILEQAGELPMTYDGPVFAGVPGGMGRLVEALADDLRARGVAVRTGATVRELRRTPEGFRLTVGPTTRPEAIDARAVVLATPAAPTARLLADVTPIAAAALALVEHASVAVVTMAFREADVPALVTDESSGFLVPPVEGRRIKASTFSAAKWGWVRAAGAAHGLVHLRTSLGRHHEAVALQASDEELLAWSLTDLRDLAGLAAAPVDRHVQRWGGGLPQYARGHLDRVSRARAAVAEIPGLALCGAAYDGVGIPQVVASGHRAAREVAAQWVA